MVALVMRVEKNQELKQELERTKEQLSSEIKRETRKSHPILTCLIIVVAVLFVFGGWATSLVAKTGLWEIPVFTNLFYEPPVPTRVVVASGSLNEALTQELTDLVNQRVQEAGGPDIDRDLSLDIQESLMTAAVQTSLTSGPLGGSGSQIAAIKDQGLEAFLPFTESELNTALVIQLMPRVDQEGSLQVDVNEFRLGQLKAPTWLVNLILRRPITLATWELEREIAKYAELSSVAVYEGYLKLTGELTLEILSL